MLKAELATAQGTATAGFAKSQGEITKMTTCLPEISGQINGLQIETSSSSGWLTSAYLSQHKQVSTYCQSTLEGTGH